MPCLFDFECHSLYLILTVTALFRLRGLCQASTVSRRRTPAVKTPIGRKRRFSQPSVSPNSNSRSPRGTAEQEGSGRVTQLELELASLKREHSGCGQLQKKLLESQKKVVEVERRCSWAQQEANKVLRPHNQLLGQYWLSVCFICFSGSIVRLHSLRRDLCKGLSTTYCFNKLTCFQQ